MGTLDHGIVTHRRPGPIPTGPVPRLNISRAFQLRFLHNLSETEIARQFNVSKQAVNQALKPFKNIMLNKQTLDAYAQNKENVLKSASLTLILDCLDPKKRAQASLNNAAYAAKQIHEIYRLETNQTTSNVDMHVVEADLSKLQADRDKLRAKMAKLVGPVSCGIRDGECSEMPVSLPKTDNSGINFK
jgi:predicted DNA-binding protein YlxM (UPF0122 family)